MEIKKVKVELLSPKENPEKIVAAAAKVCYSEKAATDLMADLTEEKIQKFIDKLSSMGHESPFEHVSFTFSIEGVSRVLLAQITRHRIASFSVRSQRYVDETNFGVIVPSQIMDNPRAFHAYMNQISSIRDAYQEICELLVESAMSDMPEDCKDEDGYKRSAIKRAQEDARYILPNCCETKMVVTMNARSLFNFFKLRCCNRAQSEIRELATQMYKLCIEVAPNIFKYAGPPCLNGACPEGVMSCGKVDSVRANFDRIRGN